MDELYRDLERRAKTGDLNAERRLHELRLRLYGHADCGTCAVCEAPCSVVSWYWLDQDEHVVLIKSTCGHEFSAGGFWMNNEFKHAIGCNWCRKKYGPQ